MQKFAIGEAVKFGWEKMKKHFWFFAGLLVILWLAQIIPTGIANIFKGKVFILYFLFILAAWFIQVMVKMGAVKIALEVADNDKSALGTLFSQLHCFFNFFFSAILYGLIVLGGLILLIVPGIIWAIKYQFFSYLVIDKNFGPLEAIKKSGEITAGHKSKLFGLGVVLFLINLAGAIVLLVGLFATIPLSMMAMVYVYRKLLGGNSAPAPTAAPETPAPAAGQTA